MVSLLCISNEQNYFIYIECWGYSFDLRTGSSGFLPVIPELLKTSLLLQNLQMGVSQVS